MGKLPLMIWSKAFKVLSYTFKIYKQDSIRMFVRQQVARGDLDKGVYFAWIKRL